MTGSGRFIPAMTIVSAVVKPQERGTFMSLENASRQLSSGAASQIAGLIIGSTAAGALTNYNYVGLVGKDKRNYKVDFRKLEKSLKFKTKHTVEYGAKEVITILKKNKYNKKKFFYGNYKIENSFR